MIFSNAFFSYITFQREHDNKECFTLRLKTSTWKLLIVTCNLYTFLTDDPEIVVILNFAVVFTTNMKSSRLNL